MSDARVSSSEELALLEAARAGDARAFERLVAPYRKQLEAHGYRMLGSLADADDVAQETLVRAWKGLGGYEGRASVRTWLHRIATNVALDVSARRKPRALPNERGAPSDPRAGLAPPDLDPVWLDPAPPDLWEELPESPEASVSARESVGLAFLVAIQRLPATQRAALLLREVLGMSAAEVADLLETTVPAVNSALQRARAALDEDERVKAPRRDDEGVRALLARYVSAWEQGTPDALAAVLREDAVLTMPPIPTWFQGVAAIAGLVAFLKSTGELRITPARAAGGPALAYYVREHGEEGLRLATVSVVSFDDAGLVREVHSFMNPAQAARFGLAATLA